MHVKGREIAVTGLLAGFTVVLMTLSSVIESSSLFFIAGASFCVGIVIREWGLKMGAAFLVATIFLNLLVAPNKMYCITFAAMGVYLFLSEWLYEKIANALRLKNRRAVLWIGKYVVFNMIYLPMLCFLPELFFAKKVSQAFMIGFVVVGQVVFFVYDQAYMYFQSCIWGKLRGKLRNE